MKHTPEYKALVEIINCYIGDDVKHIQKVESIAFDAVENYELAQDELLKALERCYEVFSMDEIDTALSMQCGMAISKAKGE